MKVGTAQTVDSCVYAENLGKSEVKTYVQLQYIFEHGTCHLAKSFIASSGSSPSQMKIPVHTCNKIEQGKIWYFVKRVGQD